MSQITKNLNSGSIPPTVTQTISGNTGTATASGNNINVVGSGSITAAASGSTDTISLTGLTNHNVLLGAGTATITNVAPGASGTVLTSNGTTSDPSFQSSVPALPVSLANGGTGASLTANNGGIFYSNASTGAILNGTATARQMLQSGSTAAPAWSTATWPATTAINQILYSSSVNNVTGLATANNGALITSASGVPSIGTVPIAAGGTNATSMTTSNGIVKYNGTSLVTSTATIDSSNRMINPSQPLVLAYMNTPVTNVTGDSTSYSVIFDSTDVNQGSAYSTSTGLFTVPVSGNYLITTSLTYTGLGALYTLGNLVIQNSGGTIWTHTFAPGKIYNSNNSVTVNNSIVWNLTAAQTINITTLIAGSTKTVGIDGVDFGNTSWLSIVLLPA
jgi:hypothetical protein